jgi:hypothetical protein
MVAAAAGLLVRTWRNLTQQQTAGHDPTQPPPPPTPINIFFFTLQNRIKKAYHKTNRQKKNMIKKK